MRLGLVICCAVFMLVGCSEQTQPDADLPSRPLTEEESKLAWGLSRGLSGPQLELYLKLKEYDLGQESNSEVHESLVLKIKGAIKLQKESGVYRIAVEGISDTEVRSLTESMIKRVDLPTDRSVESWSKSKKLDEIKDSEKSTRESIVADLKSESFADISTRLVEVKFLREVKKALSSDDEKPKQGPSMQ